MRRRSNHILSLFSLLALALLVAACGGGNGVGPGTPLPGDGGTPGGPGEPGGPGDGGLDLWEPTGWMRGKLGGENFEMTTFVPKERDAVSNAQPGPYTVFTRDGDFFTVHLTGYEDNPSVTTKASLSLRMNMEIRADGRIVVQTDSNGELRADVTYTGQGASYSGRIKTLQFEEGPTVEWEDQDRVLKATGKFTVTLFEPFVENPEERQLEAAFDVHTILLYDSN